MPADLPQTCDVAIVGGGPAGLAAACELRAAGIARVVVLEREACAGGIPRHSGHSPYGMREFRRILRGPAYAARLVAVAQAAGAGIFTGVAVTAVYPGGRLDLTTPDGPAELTASRVLLCTGVREKTRAALLIGGTKPGGVLSTAALQGMVYLNKQRPFLRPVILGTELVAFSALLTCRHAGIRPVAMIEAGPRAVARWPAALLPRMLGIPLWTGTTLRAIHGAVRVTGVTLQGPDGATRQIAADGVIVTGAFLPEASLLRASHLEVDGASGGPVIDSFGRCSDPVYFAAGNLLRAVETAGRCWAEGRRAGQAIALDLAGRLPAPSGALCLTLHHPALKYAVPQRIVPGGAHGSVDLRVTRAVKGRLSLRIAGAEVWSQRLSALPERRLSVPLAAFASYPGATDTAELVLEEDTQ